MSPLFRDASSLKKPAGKDSIPPLNFLAAMLLMKLPSGKVLGADSQKGHS